MIINESNILYEARTIDLGGGKSAYQYDGKYYIKSGDTKKEISADQYNKLRSKDQSNDENSSTSNSKEIQSNIIDKVSDISMSMSEFKEFVEDEKEYEDAINDLNKAGMDPSKCILFDSEGLYDLGRDDRDFINRIFDDQAIDSKEISDEEYNYSTLYTFNDGSKVLRIDNSGGYMSGVDTFFVEK